MLLSIFGHHSKVQISSLSQVHELTSIIVFIFRSHNKEAMCNHTVVQPGLEPG